MLSRKRFYQNYQSLWALRHHLFDILGGHVHFAKTDFSPYFQAQNIYFSNFQRQIFFSTILSQVSDLFLNFRRREENRNYQVIDDSTSHVVLPFIVAFSRSGYSLAAISISISILIIFAFLNFINHLYNSNSI